MTKCINLNNGSFSSEAIESISNLKFEINNINNYCPQMENMTQTRLKYIIKIVALLLYVPTNQGTN